MANIVPKPVREFTREQPCDKVHLFLCFNQSGRYVRRAVVEARGEIGVNAIKYLKREDYAREYEAEGVDWWELTQAGQAWLTKGLARYLELHPQHRARLAEATGHGPVRKRPKR